MHAQSSHGRGAVSNGGVGGVGRVGGGEGGGFNSNFRQLRPNSGIDLKTGDKSPFIGI